MISVIIPAHNEELVVARCLSAILTGARSGELQVIVACNGCTDRTAEIAREFGEPVKVLELEVASKTAALNAAEQQAIAFPRFYIDADVTVDLESIRRMGLILTRGEALMATPELQLDCRHSSWPVRAFYRVWTELPYNRVGGRVGTGVYALSQTGRQRFLMFPNVINDDGFVRLAFSRDERVTVTNAVSRVQPPRTLSSLIRAKTRVRTGYRQLRALLPDQVVSDGIGFRQLCRWLLLRPEIWLLLPVYGIVSIVIRWASHWKPRSQSWDWGRDDSRTNELDIAHGARVPNSMDRRDPP